MITIRLYQHGDKTGYTRSMLGNVVLGTYDLDKELSLIDFLE